MKNKAFLENFAKECAAEAQPASGQKFVGWEELVFTLVGFGLKMILPEIKEWIKLGATTITMKRLKIRQKLIDYAIKKELDFPAAEKAAEAISNRIDDVNIGKIVEALEN